jgi:hypothetical protein
MRNHEIGTVERAFQLAGSSECQTIEDIRKQLRREQCGNIDAHLAGSSIRRQLTQKIALRKKLDLVTE